MSLGEALGKILGRKFWDQKQIENMSTRCLPWRLSPTPARRDLGRIRARWARSNTPSLILRMGGRIVCALRHPPMPLGGLENWRVGELEDGRVERTVRIERIWGIWMMSDE